MSHDALSVKGSQRGAVLIIALILLLLMTLVSTTSMQSSGMLQRISGNVQESNIAFHAAESGVLEGEAWLESQLTAPAPTTTCSTYPCVVVADPTLFPAEKDNTWWQGNSASSTSTLNAVGNPPRYIVQYLYFVPDDLTLGYGTKTGKDYYAITARGTGRSNNAQTVIRTTYAKRH